MVDERAQTLTEGAPDCDDDELVAEIDEFTTDLTDRTNDLHDKVEHSTGTFAVLLTILDYNNSRHIYTVRRLQTAYAEAHTETTKTALDDMRELFKQINTPRQYFKTVYLQRELSELSRMTVYTGIIATLVASVMILVYGDLSTATLHPTLYYILFSGALAAIQSPLAVLFSYAMRTATISRKTAAFGPFIPEEEQQQVSDSNNS